MWPALIVEIEEVGDLQLRFTGGFISMQINMLVFHCAPESFNKDIIPPGTLTIQTDLNTVINQVLSKCQAGKLTGSCS